MTVLIHSKIGTGGTNGSAEGPSPLLGQVDFFRLDASRRLDPKQRSEMGQFMTPEPVARLMASMFQLRRPTLRILDAGAGVGSLSAALVTELCGRENRPEQIDLTAYEVDESLAVYLADTLQACREECMRTGISFRSELLREDFIAAGVEMLRGGLFGPEPRRFDCAILNPPYRKIHSESDERRLLREIGVETSNLYTGFLSIVVGLLELGGELVAITPRSFCNGPYFKPFRDLFLTEMALRRIHVFESRTRAFQDDEVLQENLIFHAIKGGSKTHSVLISSSLGPEDECPSSRLVGYQEVVRPDDPDAFIHIVPDDLGQQVADQMTQFTASLGDCGLAVSTGRVVDFRAKNFLRTEPGSDTVPLIYPQNLRNGFVEWPVPGRKPTALVHARDTQELMVPPGVYVLVKRFSAKEERRRVVAALYDPSRVAPGEVGFENHLNYYHCNGRGLDYNLAKGLTAFLNSTLLDEYFRQFNGHTQVNATDLRSLRYPSTEQLEALGAQIGEAFPSQDELDRLIEEELLRMPEDLEIPNPVEAKKKIEQALEVLRNLGFPRQQQNGRSALTLLALLDLKPETPWAEAANPLRGVTQMMKFFEDVYGKRYAPNSRETVRRQTVHQFMEAGLTVANPDQPSRPTNSGNTVYQVGESALALLRSYGVEGWQHALRV